MSLSSFLLYLVCFLSSCRLAFTLLSLPLSHFSMRHSNPLFNLHSSCLSVTFLSFHSSSCLPAMYLSMLAATHHTIPVTQATAHCHRILHSDHIPCILQFTLKTTPRALINAWWTKKRIADLDLNTPITITPDVTCREAIEVHREIVCVCVCV